MFKFRVRVLCGLFLAGFLLLLGRLAQLQLVRGAYYRELIQQLRTQEHLRPALRGPILDRCGRPLARDLPSFDLAVRVDALRLESVSLKDVQKVRQDHPNTEQLHEALRPLCLRLMADPWVRRLAQKTRGDEETLAQGVLEALDRVARKWAHPSTPVPILRGLDEATWTALRSMQEDAFLNGSTGCQPVRETAHGQDGRNSSTGCQPVRETAHGQDGRATGPPEGKPLPPLALSTVAPASDAESPPPGFPGLLCTHSVRREYPYGKLLAHVLGTLGELTPEQTEELRGEGVLMEHLTARRRLWAVYREGLDDGQADALRGVLGADPRQVEDLGRLLSCLGALDPGRRQEAARLGLADFVRWSERPPRIALCEAERLWLGCGEAGPRGPSSRTAFVDGRVGETGVECWYNEWLRGKHGLALGAAARNVPSATSTSAPEEEQPGVGQASCLSGQTRMSAPPREGHALALTISFAWQQACERALAGIGKPAAAVVLDCRTGEVLALASQPTFDPNLFSPPREGRARLDQLRALLHDPAKPLLNRAIAERYPLGSVMKPLIAAAALEKGLVQPDEHHVCEGYLQEGKTRYHCDGHRSHGDVNLIEALRRSCNVYFYRLGARVGVEGLAPFARALGFGRRTGLDAPGEVPGIYPDRAWRLKTFPTSPPDQAWSRGKDYHLAIGQGYLAVTPLQVACMMATLANGGYAVTPRLWLEAPATPPRAPLFSGVTLAVVRQGLDEVCNFGTPGARGTAYSAFHRAGETLAVRVAGKTGTADVAQTGVQPHAWFAGFAPSESPQVAFCIFIENGGHGGEAAAPVAYRILREVYGTSTAPQTDPGGMPVAEGAAGVSPADSRPTGGAPVAPAQGAAGVSPADSRPTGGAPVAPAQGAAGVPPADTSASVPLAAAGE